MRGEPLVRLSLPARLWLLAVAGVNGGYSVASCMLFSYVFTAFCVNVAIGSRLLVLLSVVGVLVSSSPSLNSAY